MGAVFLLCLVVLMVVNTMFTYWIWKGGFRMKPKEMQIPRGVPVVKEPDVVKEDVDYSAIAAMVNDAIATNAEESGEDETQVSADEIAKIAQSVLANMKA